MASHPNAALPMPVRAGPGWLYGPSADLLLGAGLGYVVSIPLLVWFAAVSGLSDWPIVAFAFLTLFVSGPHYGATILRVYEQRRDRRRYAFFAVWATLALCALFVMGLHDAVVGSLLITLYVSWSPWHFSGQNYGLSLMFLRRRGIVVEQRVKRLMYASFVLSFLLWILILHGEGYASTVALFSGPKSSAYQFLSLRLSNGILAVAFPLTALAYALSLVAAFLLLLRNARLRDLGPYLCLVSVQGLWFAVPALTRALAGISLNSLAFSIVWINSAHGAQYLWVTSYYAKREDPSHRLGPYLTRALLAGSTVTILPGLVFAPALLGTVPWDMGLSLLVLAVSNLHHFILDGAIWKLRDGRVSRLLLREAPVENEEVPTLARHRSWFRLGMAFLGVVSLSIAGFDVWQRSFVISRPNGNVERMIRAANWLAWIGRDPPAVHAYAAALLAERGEPDAAIAEYRRSIELHPTPAAWVGLGRVHASLGDWASASEAYSTALAENPNHLMALVSASEAWMQMGRPDRARESLERARDLAPTSEKILGMLQRVVAEENASSPEREAGGSPTASLPGGR